MEVKELSVAFNYLTERLAATMKTIEEEQRKLYTVLSSMEDLLLAVDQTGTVVLVNPAFATVVGKAEADLMGQPLPPVLKSTELARVLRVVCKESPGAPSRGDLTGPERHPTGLRLHRGGRCKDKKGRWLCSGIFPI